MGANSQAEAIKITTNFLVAGKPDDMSPADWLVSRRTVGQQLMDRVTGAALPAQAGTNLCGPASFMYCLLQDRPDLYAQFVVDLWNSGSAKLGTLDVEPSSMLRRNTPAAVSMDNPIEAVDWISLGGLRGFENSYHSPTSALAAITPPGLMKRWFQAVDSKLIFSNTRILSNSSWDELLQVSCYVQSAWVLMLINANLLAAYGTDGSASSIPDHWVVATASVNINNRIVFSYLPSANNSRCINIPSDSPPNDAWPVEMNVFSWGKKSQELKQGTSVSSFLGRYHGALVFGSVP